MSYATAAHYLPKDEIITQDFLLNVDNDDFVAFSLCDDNTVALENAHFTIYKDRAEHLQRTIQFSYYTTSKYVRFGEHFIKNNSFVNEENFIRLTGLIIDNVEADDFKEGEWFDDNPRIVAGNPFSNRLLDYVGASFDGEQNIPFIYIDWDGIETAFGEDVNIVSVVGITHITPISLPIRFYDYCHLISFLKPVEGGIQRYFVTLNDTKTDYVMGEQNGILYRKHKVQTNTFNRRVKNIEEN